jgi:hypothetical protein
MKAFMEAAWKKLELIDATVEDKLSFERVFDAVVASIKEGGCQGFLDDTKATRQYSPVKTDNCTIPLYWIK